MGTTTKADAEFQLALHNATSLFTELEESESQIKNDMFSVDLFINYLLCGCLAIFGTVNNIINMVIFYRLGLKDSMSFGLMMLSATDFLSSFAGLSGIAFVIMDKHFPDSGVQPRTINYVSFGWLRDILFLCSAWITAILSVERCVCVVYPFKVKEIFTRARCIMAIVVIYVVHAAVHLPVFLTHRLVWSKVEVKTATNITVLYDQLTVKLAHNRAQVQLFVDIANGAVLPIPSQALVLISVIWMIHGLRVSSRVRKAQTQSNKTDQSGKETSNLSPKEVRLIKVVCFLAIILTLCMIPRFIAVYAKQIFPGINFGNKYGYLYAFLWNLVLWAQTINGSTNIFVYLIVNTSYRAKFKAMFVI